MVPRLSKLSRGALIQNLSQINDELSSAYDHRQVSVLNFYWISYIVYTMYFFFLGGDLCS